jgi:hypothetical protein
VVGVVPKVKPTLVSPAVGARQRKGDVRITPALHHPEVGATDCRHERVVLQAGELEEVLEEVSLSTNPQVPLTQCLERRHLLDVVRVEVLELLPVLEEHGTDELPSGDGETALMERHE